MHSLQNALLFQAELMAFGLAKVCHPSFALAGLKWLFFREKINHSSTSAGVYTEEWTQTALPIRIKENTNNTRPHYKKKSDSYSTTTQFPLQHAVCLGNSKLCMVGTSPPQKKTSAQWVSCVILISNQGANIP